MKFKIIPNEQTPETISILSVYEWIFLNKKLLEKFLSFASRQHNCAGLAANQVSVDGERIMRSFFAIKDGHFWDMVIEPYISIYKGEGEDKTEGCLTWLGRKIIAKRWSSIDVRYWNLKGEFIKKSVVGLQAQIWQHEYNHLMGIEEKFLQKGE